MTFTKIIKNLKPVGMHLRDDSTLVVHIGLGVVQVDVDDIETVARATIDRRELDLTAVREAPSTDAGAFLYRAKLAPVVVVKARGRISSLRTAQGEVWLFARTEGPVALRNEDSLRIAARAYADDAEVEIYTVDGGPNQIRVVA